MADDEVSPERTFPARDVEAAQRAAHEKYRQFLIDSVWNDEMLPSEAEAVAARTGLLFGGSDGPVTMTSTKWSLAQSVVWIAWRDSARIQEQWWRLHAWSGSLWRDPLGEHQVVTFEQAEKELWAALEDGRVQATGLAGQGSKPVRIEPLDWSNLVWMPDKTRLSVRYSGQPDEAYRCVDVKSADVLAAWPAPGSPLSDIAVAPAVTAEPKKQDRPRASQGGRVMADHWHDMWAEVCRIVHEEGPPRNRLEIVKRMQQWFVDRDLEEPSNQTLNPILDKLMQALKD